MPENWTQWAQKNTDKIFLLLAFYATISLVLHLAHHSMDQGLLSWAEGLAGQAFAAFLTLLVGRKNQDGDATPTTTITTKSTITKLDPGDSKA